MITQADKTAEYLKALNILHPEGGVIELRKIDNPASGYYKNYANAAEKASESSATIYIVMNDINDGVYYREQSECMKVSSGRGKGLQTTSDGDITRLRWILIDCDPKRPSGISSTDAEKERAHQTAKKIYAYLKARHFPDPVCADSGNGYHLLYRVNMEPGKSELVKRFLLIIDMLFSDEAVDIDKAVFNPARITKLYGTKAMKGADSPDRPHRWSSILSSPNELVELKEDELRAFCDELMPLSSEDEHTSSESFDIELFMSKHNLSSKGAQRCSNGTIKYVLDECPFDSSHRAPDSAIFQFPSGAVAFRCLHNSCAGYKWQDLRRKLEPDYSPERKIRARIVPPHPVSIEVKNGFLDFAAVMEKRAIRNAQQIPKIPSGIGKLDELFYGGFSKGEVTIWSGGNGSGKSTFMSQLAIEAIQAGERVLMFSGELPAWRVADWVLLQACGNGEGRLRELESGRFAPELSLELKIQQWLTGKLFVYDNELGLGVDQLKDSITQQARAQKCDVIIIDNLMSLDLAAYGDRFTDQNEKQTELIRSYHQLAVELGVHIHFVCHPRKAAGFIRKADISGSSNLTNYADNVLIMHRVNRDFETNYGAAYGQQELNRIMSSRATNIVEVVKNRDYGVEDAFVELYYSAATHKLNDCEHPRPKPYGWETIDLQETEEELPDGWGTEEV